MMLLLSFSFFLPSQIGVVVQWSFELPACGACIDQQLDLLKRYGQPGDQVVISAVESQSQEVEDLVSRLPVWVANGTVLKRQRLEEALGNGFRVTDRDLGERVEYRSYGGFYNKARAMVILELYRYENSFE